MKPIATLLFLLFLSCAQQASAQTAESHNFVTYDTTYNVGYGNLKYILRITRPVNMFTKGSPDTASRPAIIHMAGTGQVGNDASLTASYGPHYLMARTGWDGGIQLGNGRHYPIIISVQPNIAWPQTNEIYAVLNYILNTYHIKRNSVHLMGMDMGACAWSALICHQASPGAESGMKLVTSLVALQGQSNSVSTNVVQYQLGGANSYASFGRWAKKYKGKYFGLEGASDNGRNLWKIQQPMNDSMPGSAYFAYENYGGGGHCCWGSMYDTTINNWGCIAPIRNTNIISNTYYPNSMGTYKIGSNLFQWALRQGDTSMVSATTTQNMTPPTVSAGAAQTITLPLSTVTLKGTATAASGTTVSKYAWTQTSGLASVITTPTTATTTVTGLVAGTYTYKLTATTNTGASASSTVTITVNPLAILAPIVNAGASIVLTLPTTSTTLNGTASDPNGGSIRSYSWKQTSGATAAISSPSTASTTVTGLTTGTYTFQLTVTTSEGSSASSSTTITVNAAATSSTPVSKLTVKKVICSEYRTWYIASDGNIYAFFNFSPTVVQHPIGGRKAVDGVGAFNEFRVLDDQGYIWRSVVDLMNIITTRYDVDASGAPFNNNIGVYAYENTTTTIRSDGSVWYFGDDTFHLFHSSGKVDMKPTRLSPAGMSFKKIAMGGTRIVGLTTAGDVYEWLPGKGTTPAKKTIPSPAFDIFASHLDYAGCLISPTPGGTTGYPYVWGYYFGAWGGNAAWSQPTSVQALWGVKSPIRTIDVNWNSTHYIDDQNRMWGLGFNVQGEVGIGNEFVNQYTYGSPYAWSFTDGQNFSGLPAKQIRSDIQWSALFSNNWFAFYKYAIDINGNLYSWGRNKALVLGNGYLNMQEQYYPNSMDVTVPTKVTPLATIFQEYNFTLPAINAGTNQTINTSTATLKGTASPATLIKNTTLAAANGISQVGFNIVSYQWTLASGNSAAAVSITTPNSPTTTVTGLKPGNYVFALVTTDNNGGTQRATTTINVNNGTAASAANTATSARAAALGLDSTGMPSYFTVSPNPARDNITLAIGNAQTGVMNVQLISESGAVKRVWQLNKAMSTFTSTLPVGNLAPGIYFIRVQVGSWSETKKLLKL